MPPDAAIYDNGGQAGQAKVVSTLSFVIADDSKAFRRILRQIVESHPDWSVVAEAQDGQDAVQLARVYFPNVVLIDVVMPTMNGIEAAKRIKQIVPNTRIIAFSAHHEEEFRFKGLQVGADYFVWKEELDGASLSRMVDSLFSAPTAHQPADA